jgi:lipopolysaccharide transport system permease protein
MDNGTRSNNWAIYAPEPVARHPAVMLRGMVAGLAASRNLAWQLIVRDIRAQYRQAALGLAWAFLLPVANAATWLFLHSSGVVRIPATVMPYPAFVISGTLLWAIFMEALNAPLLQTQLAKPMLAKINFPREALLLSGIGQGLFNGAIKILVMMVALLLLGVTPGWSVALLPCVAGLLVLLGTAVGLWLVPIGMLYSDIGRGLPLLMQFLMFLTPVVYAAPRSGWAATVMQWNPVTPLLDAAREILTGQWPTDVAALTVVGLWSLAILLPGWLVYRAAMPILIERMSA